MADALPRLRGWMLKRATAGVMRKLNSYTRRFFVLEPGILRYYESDRESPQYLKGALLIQPTTADVMMGGDVRPDVFPFTFICDGKHMDVQAATADECALWVAALREHIEYVNAHGPVRSAQLALAEVSAPLPPGLSPSASASPSPGAAERKRPARRHTRWEKSGEQPPLPPLPPAPAFQEHGSPAAAAAAAPAFQDEPGPLHRRLTAPDRDSGGRRPPMRRQTAPAIQPPAFQPPPPPSRVPAPAPPPPGRVPAPAPPPPGCVPAPAPPPPSRVPAPAPPPPGRVPAPAQV